MSIGTRRQLAENMGALFLLQGANYVLPLITLPYLVRVLGPENFGLVAFAQALTQYFVVLTDYGFNLTATREIALNRDDPQRISEIFCSVMLIKLGLLLASFLLLISLVFVVPRFRDDWPVYLVTFLLVVGQVMFPLWFFQGMQRVKYITALNITGRLFVVFAVFALVRERSDYVLAAGLQASGAVLAGALALCAVRRVMPVRLVVPSVKEIKTTLHDGWYVFVSQISNTLRGNSSVFVLGLFYGDLVVGYFSVAERIIRAGILLAAPIGTTVYPRVSATFAQSREAAVAFLRKTLLFGGLGFAALGVGLLLGADLLVRLIAGEAHGLSILLIRTMAFVPLLSFLCDVYGMQVLLPLRMNRQFMYAILYAGLFSLTSALVLVPAFGAVGSAVAFVASQALALLLVVAFAHRAGVQLHRAAP